jgi:cytoplasmic iron level regulating protein YaaA (DUF328/UPF0246 family)
MGRAADRVTLPPARVSPGDRPRLAHVLILLPPSEGKTPARRGRPLDLSALSFPSLTARRESVITALEQVSGQLDAPAVLGVSAALDDQVRRNLELRTAPTAAAVQVYSGVLYQALDHASLDSAAKRRANRAIVVISAAFGALRLTDRVPAYRVHVCAHLPGVGPLAREWRGALADALDAAVKPRELIVDCRSTTYAAMWRPTDERAHAWVQVVVPGASHNAKHTRGLVTRALVQAEAPRSPGALAERLSERFDLELTAPPRAGRPWTLAVQELPHGWSADAGDEAVTAAR